MDHIVKTKKLMYVAMVGGLDLQSKLKFLAFVILDRVKVNQKTRLSRYKCWGWLEKTLGLEI